MIISVIAPPDNSPGNSFSARPVPTMQSSLVPAEDCILRAVRSLEPVHIWKLLNRLVEEESPRSRDEVRRRKLELWQLVNGLLRRRMLFRAGRHGIASTKPSPPKPRFKQPGRKREKTSTVVHRTGDSVGSAAKGTPLQTAGSLSEEPAMQGSNAPCVTDSTEAAAKSAAPLSQDERSNAARALAKLRWKRRPRKKWSGWLDKQTRIWRGRKVVVDNQVWFAYGCLRNKLVISLDDGKLLGWPGEDDLRWCVVPAHTATVWRDSHAQALGRLKRGKKEEFSELKAETARRNGAKRRRANIESGSSHATGLTERTGSDCVEVI